MVMNGFIGIVNDFKEFFNNVNIFISIGRIINNGQGDRPVAPTRHFKDYSFFNIIFFVFVFFCPVKKIRLSHFALARGWSVTKVIPTRRDNDNSDVFFKARLPRHSLRSFLAMTNNDR